MSERGEHSPINDEENVELIDERQNVANELASILLELQQMKKGDVQMQEKTWEDFTEKSKPLLEAYLMKVDRRVNKEKSPQSHFTSFIEDAVQDTHAKLHEIMINDPKSFDGKIKDPGYLVNWLKTCARNFYTSYIRGKSRFEAFAPVSVERHPGLIENIDQKKSEKGRLNSEEFNIPAKSSIEKMSDKLRPVAQLFYLERLETEEIIQQLRISNATLARRLKEINEILKRELPKHSIY